MLEVMSWSEGRTTIRLKGTCCLRFIIPGPYYFSERAQVWQASYLCKTQIVVQNIRIVAQWWTSSEDHLLRLYFGVVQPSVVWLAIYPSPKVYKANISKQFLIERPPRSPLAIHPSSMYIEIGFMSFYESVDHICCDWILHQWHWFSVTAPIYQRSRFLAIGLFLNVRSANHHDCDTMLCHIIISAVHAFLKLHITEITGSNIFYH